MPHKPEGECRHGEASAQMSAKPPTGISDETGPHEIKQTSGKQGTPAKKKENAFSRFLGKVDDVILHKRAEPLYALLILIATGINVWVAYKQYTNGLEDARIDQANTEKMIGNANEIAKALQATVTQNAILLDANIQTFREDRRAWIVPYEITLGSDLEAGKPVEIVITAKNSGKTPALARLTVKVLITREIKPSDITNLGALIVGESIMLGPEGSSISTLQVSLPIKEEEIAFIKGNTLTIVAIGKITYTDIFGRPHVTSFCHFFSGDPAKSKKFSTFGQWNSAD